jgi:hypothetical protein
MNLNLNNLVKSLIGRRARANHPITVCNPEEFFIICDAKLEHGKLSVRGENTIWFVNGMVEVDPPNDEGVDVDQILRHLQVLASYAYEMGYHELGYDPVEEIKKYIKY